jgi:hypothetical protein
MIVLKTPKFEIKHKVYFDKNTGDIQSISNVEQDFESFFPVQIDDVRDFLNGNKSITTHKVVYDVRTSSYVIVSKNKKIESDVNDNVYKITPTNNAQVIVKYKTKQNSWNISLSDEAKIELEDKKERINQNLRFSVTQKNNPNILHEYFTTTVEHLIDNELEVSSQTQFNLEDFSVYTNRRFQKYSCEVVNE